MAKKKTAKKAKGDEWKHEHVSGKAHPDNKPPLQIVAQASDEAAEKEAQSLDAVRQKETVPDWAQMPGGKPPPAGTPAAEVKAPKKAAAKGKQSPATDLVLGGSAPEGNTGSGGKK